MSICIVDGCTKEGIYRIGIRLRRPHPKPGKKSSGTAIWSPETGARLCDKHATQGMKVIMLMVPTNTGTISTETSCPPGTAVKRSTPITHAAEED
jgi:hypothetical protein